MAEEKKEIYEDPELDALLDDTLQDFSKQEAASASGTSKSVTADDGEAWNVEFLAEQAKQFQEKMAAIFAEDADPETAETVAKGLQKMAEAANMALHDDKEGMKNIDADFTESINAVLKSLSEGQETLQNPFSPDDLAGMFQGMDVNPDSAGDAFMPFMQNMMQSLLSAEILLPSLKDLVERYPAWLDQNAEKLSAEEKGKYTQQLGLMKDVCAELESEKPSDSAEVKKERFNRVLEKMQKMQDLGQPPTELVGEMGGATGAMPGFPDGGPSQCPVM